VYSFRVAIGGHRLFRPPYAASAPPRLFWVLAQSIGVHSWITHSFRPSGRSQHSSIFQAAAINGEKWLLVTVTGNGGTLQNHTGLTNLLRLADEVGGCDRSSLMAQPTTQPEPVTAFLEPSQQLQTQVSDWIFRIPSPRKRAAAPAVAVLDRICATARGRYG
jgi:hypothetical protein